MTWRSIVQWLDSYLYELAEPPVQIFRQYPLLAVGWRSWSYSARSLRCYMWIQLLQPQQRYGFVNPFQIVSPSKHQVQSFWTDNQWRSSTASPNTSTGVGIECARSKFAKPQGIDNVHKVRKKLSFLLCDCYIKATIAGRTEHILACLSRYD